MIRIGTRKSPLALAQAEQIRDRLVAAWPTLAGRVELVPFITSGDRFTGQPLSEIGGKGLFTKEIEEALLDGSIDLAVHSMKDMPTVLPDGLIIACMPEREDVRDMLVGRGIASLADVPQGAVIGTSSLRRAALIKLARPDVAIVPLRGNVQTRLDKLEQGQMRATLLARAGLNRLGLYDVPGVVLPVETFLPAVAQGAIGVECRANDTKIREYLAPLSHMPTEGAVHCERAFLRVLDGSCRTPIAGYAAYENERLYMRGLIARPDGSVSHAVEMEGTDPLALGHAAGIALLAKAGKGFLD